MFKTSSGVVGVVGGVGSRVVGVDCGSCCSSSMSSNRTSHLLLVRNCSIRARRLCVIPKTSMVVSVVS